MTLRPSTRRSTRRGGWRAVRRRLRFGLPTVLGLARRGFFIPYRYAARLPVADGRSRYPAVESMFRDRAGTFAEMLDGLTAFAADFDRIGHESRPRWEQDWFPRLDAAMAYAMVRWRKPARIVEVGSGHSTHFLARAVQDGGLATTLTVIDPAPGPAVGRLPVVRLDDVVTAVGTVPFDDLAAGDVLFIDSSHILMPGTDVDFLLNGVLPRLPAGALVHIHDVFLPDGYPAAWAWRGYNEQLALPALIAGGGWRILFASQYATTRMAARVAASAAGRLPLAPGAHETSLWLQRAGR